MPTFEYQPLESKRHIRLLKLARKKDPAPVKDTPSTCDGLIAAVQHFCLDDGDLPAYEPVSYVWAGCTPKTFIGSCEEESEEEKSKEEESKEEKSTEKESKKEESKKEESKKEESKKEESKEKKSKEKESKKEKSKKKESKEKKSKKKKFKKEESKEKESKKKESKEEESEEEFKEINGASEDERASNSSALEDPHEGAKRDREILLADGQSMIVSRSLLIALPCLTAVSETGYLWIDQLCINQDDLVERSEQVGIMHNIYAGGSRTLIWLGEDTKDMEYLRDFRDTFGKVLKSSKMGEWATSHDGDEREQIVREKIKRHKKKTLAIVLNDLRSALNGLWNRSWFTRIWILQEFLHSENAAFITDTHLHSPFDIMIASSLRYDLEKVVNGSSGEFRSGNRVFSAMLIRGGNPKLASDLRFRREGTFLGCTQASDPRDCVFALLNIVENEIDIPKADYTLKDAQVFAEATKFCFGSEGSLDILGVSDAGEYGLKPTKIDHLPSWAPDFSRESGVQEPLHGNFSMPSPFNACARRLHAPISNQPWNILACKGAIIDIITWVDREPDLGLVMSNPDERHLSNPAGRLHRQLRKTGAIDATTTRLLHLITHGIRLELNRQRSIRYSTDSVATAQTNAKSWKKRLMRIMTKVTHKDVPDPHKDVPMLSRTDIIAVYYGRSLSHRHYPEQIEDIKNQLFGATWARRIIQASSLSLGLASSCVKPGDFIAILHGSPTPVVLRPTEDDGHYNFLGCCYLEGAMFGEAVSWKEDDAQVLKLV